MYCSERVDLIALKAKASFLAQQLKPGAIVYLTGPLGAGKTTFVQALLAHLGYEGHVKSPTYSLVESYHLAIGDFHHFDLYRLKDPAELAFIGLRDYLNGHAICLFEWPEKGDAYLPKADWQLTLAYAGEERLLTLNAVL